MLADPALEARARNLSKELRCMVCQNQSIDDSEAPLAHDLRVLVRERLKAGDSDAQVMNFLVARYGEFVLLRPPLSWHTAALWGLPPAALLIGVVAIVVIVRRRRNVPPSADRQISPPPKKPGCRSFCAKAEPRVAARAGDHGTSGHSCSGPPRFVATTKSSVRNITKF